MPTPLSLRIARLLLFAAAAGCFALVVLIAARAAFFSPLLVLFAVPLALFLAAHRTIATAPERARLLALAGAAALTSLAVLTGFGAGDVSFPAAGVGVLAAWSAWLHPPRRRTVLLFVAYVAVGLVLAAIRTRTFFLFPFLVADVLLWPATIVFLSPALAGLSIFAWLGAALAFAAYAARDVFPQPKPLLAVVLAIAIATLVVGFEIAISFARTDTSARYELASDGLAALFAAAFATTLGGLALRRAPVLAALGVGAGASILTITVISRPTVTCLGNGVSSSQGPWWLGPPGSLSSGGSGGGSSGIFTGTITRGDGTVVRYTCRGSTLTEYVIEQR